MREWWDYHGWWLRLVIMLACEAAIPFLIEDKPWRFWELYVLLVLFTILLNVVNWRAISIELW